MVNGTASVVWLQTKGGTPAVGVIERTRAQIRSVWLIGLLHILSSPPVWRGKRWDCIECYTFCSVGVVV
jgi:hypothetical protein